MMNEVVRIYGLSNCDRCRKARRALETAGHRVSLIDLRETPLDEAVLANWLTRFGDGLVNTRSMTWRGLDANERAAAPLDLLRAHPALMKRPVIVVGDNAWLGCSPAAQAALLGTA